MWTDSDVTDIRNKVIASLMVAAVLGCVRVVWARRWATWLLLIGGAAVVVYVGVTVRWPPWYIGAMVAVAPMTVAVVIVPRVLRATARKAEEQLAAVKSEIEERCAAAERDVEERRASFIEDATPRAWLPGSVDCEVKPYTDQHTGKPRWAVLWPRIGTEAEFDFFEITLMFVPDDFHSSMAAGVEVSTAGPGRIVLYLVQDAPERDGIRAFGPSLNCIQYDGRHSAGVWYTLRIEKHGDRYSAFVDGRQVFSDQKLQVLHDEAIVDDWPQRAVPKVRFDTDCGHAKVAVLRYDYGLMRK